MRKTTLWKKAVRVLACVTLLALTAAGCGTDGETKTADSDTSSDSKVYKIGVSTQGWKNEFIKNMVNALEKLDEEMDNVELVMVDSDDSVEKQLSDIDTMIAQGVDGLLLNCLSMEGSSSAVVACKNAGIPVVEFISYTENEDYETFVGTDVKSSGIMAMDVAAEAIGEEGRVFEIQGIIGHTGQINRGAGIAEALEKYPNIELVESQSGEFLKDKAMSVTEAWLAKYPKGEIDAIIAHNDQMALGALNACLAANRTEIKIVGIDGDLEALQAVADGTMAGSIVDYCEEESRYAVEEMVSILEGNEAKGEILVDYVPVTDKESAQEFIDMRSGE